MKKILKHTSGWSVRIIIDDEAGAIAQILSSSKNVIHSEYLEIFDYDSHLYEIWAEASGFKREKIEEFLKFHREELRPKGVL